MIDEVFLSCEWIETFYASCCGAPQKTNNLRMCVLRSANFHLGKHVHKMKHKSPSTPRQTHSRSRKPLQTARNPCGDKLSSSSWDAAATPRPTRWFHSWNSLKADPAEKVRRITIYGGLCVRELPYYLPILLNSQNKDADRQIEAGSVSTQASNKLRTVDICNPE
jgi:hypothetical protein